MEVLHDARSLVAPNWLPKINQRLPKIKTDSAYNKQYLLRALKPHEAMKRTN